MVMAFFASLECNSPSFFSTGFCSATPGWQMTAGSSFYGDSTSIGISESRFPIGTYSAFTTSGAGVGF